MDPTVVTIWLLRLLFLALLYAFLFGVVRVLLRDLRTAARAPLSALGRLVVVASEVDEPAAGAVFPLDAVGTLGRDVNNTIVVDDPFASAEHAVVSFRGGTGTSRTRQHEPRTSTLRTTARGGRFGDETVGRVRTAQRPAGTR